MTTSPVLLHVAHGSAFLPGLFWTILAIVVLVSFLKRGRFGPVRWDPVGRPGRRPAGPQAPEPTPEGEALTILKERLARGDITVEEYLERSDVLRNAPPSA